MLSWRQEIYLISHTSSFPFLFVIFCSERQRTANKPQICLNNIYKWSGTMKAQTKKPNSGNHTSDHWKVRDFLEITARRKCKRFFFQKDLMIFVPMKPKNGIVAHSPTCSKITKSHTIEFSYPDTVTCQCTEKLTDIPQDKFIHHSIVTPISLGQVMYFYDYL